MIGLQADALQKLDDARLQSPAIGGEPMNHQRLADDGADGHARTERRERILEDDLHVAGDGAQLVLAHGRDVLAFEPDLARGRLDEAENAAAGRRLPAAGLADEAQGLAFLDVKAHAVDRVHAIDHARQEPSANGKLLDETIHGQQRFGRHRRGSI